MCHTGEDFGILSDSQYSTHYGYEQWYCKALTDLGCDVKLIVLSYKPGISRFRHIFGHEIIRLPVSLSFGVSRQLSTELLEFISSELKDVDVFHIHSYYALLYEPLALALLRDRKKFVVQSHSINYSMTNPVHVARLYSLFFSLRLANAVLTVSPAEYSNLTRMFRLKNAILFPNAIDTTVFSNTGAPRKRNSILFVGRLWPEKGLSVLLEAFELAQEKIPDLTLTIVGRGYLQSIVQQYQQRYRQINYIPYINSREKLANIYSENELLVLPSLSEAFGIVALESLACKTPVIATNRCGVALFLKDSGCLSIVNANDAQSLSTRIVSLLESPERLKAMGETGRKTVEESYDWKTIGVKLLNIYRNL